MGKPIPNKAIVKAEQTMMDVKNPRPVLVPISKNAQAKKLTAKDPIVSNGAFNQIQDIKDDFEVLADGSQTSQNSSVCSHESPAVEGSELPWKKMKISSENLVDPVAGSMRHKTDSAIPSEVVCSLSPEERNILYTTSGYGMEIYQYQCRREFKNVGRPRLKYMDKQKELSVGMRAMLVDWFVDVCQEYKLGRPTFFLAVSLVDRVLSFVDMPRVKFQLLGATSILVASKMEEVYPPQLSDIVFITEETYEEAQILRMEKVILRVVDFDLSVPTVETFASFYVFFQPVSPKAVSLMWYLLELSSMQYDCLPFKQSHLAAAAYALAVSASSSPAVVNHFEETTVGETIDEDGILMGSFVSTASMSSYSVPTCKSKCPGILLSSWPQKLVDKTGVLNIDLVEPASALAHLHRVAGRDGNKSLFLKYSSAENHQVAKDVRMAENI